MVASKKKTLLERFILGIVKNILPKAARKCPIQGRYRIVNAKVRKQYVQTLEEGIYRYDLKAYDDRNDDFVFTSVIMEVEN